MIDDFKQTIGKLKKELSNKSEVDDTIQNLIENNIYQRYKDTPYKDAVTKLRNIVNTVFKTRSRLYFNRLKKITRNLYKNKLDFAGQQLDNLLSELKFLFFTDFIYHYFDINPKINDYVYDYLSTDFIEQSKITHDINPEKFIKTIEQIKDYDLHFCKDEFLEIIQAIIEKDKLQYEVSLDDLSKSISGKKIHLDELLISSANHKSIKNYKKSADCLEKILETDNTNPNIFYKLSEDYLNLEEYEKAQDNLLKVIHLIESKQELTDEEEHRLIDSYNRLGFSYIKQAKNFYKVEKEEAFEGYCDNLFRAIKVLKNTKDKYESNVKAYYLLVSAYLYLSDYYEKRKQIMIENPYDVEESLRQKKIQEWDEKLKSASKKARKIVKDILDSKKTIKTEKDNKPYFEYYPDLDSRRFLFHLNPFLDVGITLKCFDKSDLDRAELEDDILDILREPSKYTCFRDGNTLETPKSWILKDIDNKVVLVEEYIPEQNMFRYFKHLNHRFIRKTMSGKQLTNLKLSELEWIIDITAQLQIYLTQKVESRQVEYDYYTNGFKLRFIDQLEKYQYLLEKQEKWTISDEQRNRLIELHKRDINDCILCNKPPFETYLHLLSVDANLKNFLKNKKKIDLEIRDKKIAVIDPISAIEFATGFLSEEDEQYLHYRWLLNIIQEDLENPQELKGNIGIIQEIINKLVPIKQEVIKDLDDLLTQSYNIDKDNESEYKDYRSRFSTTIDKYISKDDQKEYNDLIKLVGVDRHLAIAADKLRDISRIKKATESFVSEHEEVGKFVESIFNYPEECKAYRNKVIDCWSGINKNIGQIVLDSLCKSDTINITDFFMEFFPSITDTITLNKITKTLMTSVEAYHDFKRFQHSFKIELNKNKIKDEIREYLLRQDDIDSNYHYYLYHLKRARINMEQLGLFDFRNKLQEAYGFWDFRGDRNNNGDGKNAI